MRPLNNSVIPTSEAWNDNFAGPTAEQIPAALMETFPPAL